jgi:hypothetical protein
MNYWPSFGSALVVALFFFTASGCRAYGGGGDEDKAPPSRDQADDVSATTAGPVADSGGGGDVGAMRDAAALVRGRTPDGTSASAGGSFRLERAGVSCSYKAA